MTEKKSANFYTKDSLTICLFSLHDLSAQGKTHKNQPQKEVSSIVTEETNMQEVKAHPGNTTYLSKSVTRVLVVCVPAA